MSERAWHWLRRMVAQAVAAQGDGQPAVVVLHERETERVDDLVLLRRADFEDWHGRVPRPEGEDAA